MKSHIILSILLLGINLFSPVQAEEIPNNRITVDANFNLHIPQLEFQHPDGIDHYRANFQYAPDEQGNALFMLSDFGEYVTLLDDVANDSTTAHDSIDPAILTSVFDLLIPDVGIIPAPPEDPRWTATLQYYPLPSPDIYFRLTKLSEVNATPIDTETPEQVNLISVSSSNTDRIQVDWMPANDAQTSHDAIRYFVHVSQQSDFQPDATTLAYQATGAVSANILGLQADTEYYVIVVAQDEHGLESWSNRLSVKTVETAAVQNTTPIQVNLAEQITAITDNQITYTADAPVPEIGELLVSSSGDGYVKKVVSVTQDNSQTIVQTEPASFAELFEDVEFSTTVKMDAVPEADNSSGVSRRSSNNQHEMQWLDSGLTLTENITPELRRVAPTPINSLPNNLIRRNVTIQNGKQIVTGSKNSQLIGAAFINEKPGNHLLHKITLKTTEPNIKVCNIKIVGFTHAEKKHIASPQAGRFLIKQDSFEHEGSITIHWLITEQYLDTSALPYRLKIEAYTDEVDDGCQDIWHNAWEETLEMEIPIYVTQGNLPNTEQKALEFNGDFNVKNTVTIDFKPEVEVGVRVKRASLQSAKMLVKANIGFRNQLHIDANGQATLNKTLAFLEPRSFVKIFVIGGIPVVVRGEFRIDLKVEGEAKGELALDLDKYFGFPNAVFGLRYTPSTGWYVEKNFNPEYKFDIKGEGEAGAELKLTLIPDLQLSFYDVASGRMLVEPYLYGNAGIHGQFRYTLDNGQDLADADYWFTDLETGGGLDLRLYAGVHFLGYNLISYPEDTKLNETDKFKHFTIIEKTPFAKLPKLTAKIDQSIIPESNSRYIRINGTHEDVSNPFKNWFGPDSYFAFQQWTEPKVIGFADDAQLLPADQAGSYWFDYTQAGEYELRLGGYSKAGKYVRQIASQTLTLTDNDNDGMVDQWEQRYGVDDPEGDPDEDNSNNLSEFKNGTFPNEKEENEEPGNQENSGTDTDSENTGDNDINSEQTKIPLTCSCGGLMWLCSLAANGDAIVTEGNLYGNPDGMPVYDEPSACQYLKEKYEESLTKQGYYFVDNEYEQIKTPITCGCGSLMWLCSLVANENAIVTEGNLYGNPDGMPMYDEPAACQYLKEKHSESLSHLISNGYYFAF